MAVSGAAFPIQTAENGLTRIIWWAYRPAVGLGLLGKDASIDIDVRTRKTMKKNTLMIVAATICGVSTLVVAGETNTRVTFTTSFGMTTNVWSVNELDRCHKAWRTTGIIVDRSKEWIGVGFVLPHSPAKAAGTESGDTLLAIGTNQVGQVSLLDVDRWLSGPTGTVIVVTIKRRGENSSQAVAIRRTDFPWAEEKRSK